MEVILLERIGKSGEIGAVVKVKDGYARNWLLPQGKVLRATPENRAYFERERTQIEARNADIVTRAQALAGQMDDGDLIILRQAGESGQLYGSVNAKDIIEALSEKLDSNADILTREMVQIKRVIKTIGVHEVSLSLHAETHLTLKVNVARNEEEAVEQAQTVEEMEAEAAAKAAAEEAVEEETAEEAEAEEEEAEAESEEAEETEAEEEEAQ